MAQNREPFLSRWSRRKRAARQPTAEPKPPAQPKTPPPELPPIDSLTPESDFSAFIAALRKLFSDPALNVVDGLDDYAEDFNQLETLAAGAAAGLEHAKRTLFGEADSQAPGETEGEPESPERIEAASNEAAEAREGGAAQDADRAPEGAGSAATRGATPPPAGADREPKA